MTPRPRKSGRKGWPENLYQQRKNGRTYYRYRNPQTGKSTGMGTDLTEAKRAARILNARLMDRTPVIDQLVARAIGSDRSFSNLVDDFITHLRGRRNTRGRGLAEKTLEEYERMLNRAGGKWGAQEAADITRRQVADFLRPLPDASANRHRAILRQAFDFAIAEGLRDDNPVAGTLTRTEVVERQRLNLDGYNAIHVIAPAWFQNALDLGLQTLQRREDLVTIRFDDEREEGWLFVDQKKVEGHGTGHVRIRIGRQLRKVIGRCRDENACPFMIHRKPGRLRREYVEQKDHPFQVTPEMLTRTFKKLRDKTGRWKDLPPKAQPTFHEIRALGADLYREAGHPEEAIQRLLGHSTPKMTQLYLDRRGTEVRYVDAAAGLDLGGRRG